MDTSGQPAASAMIEVERLGVSFGDGADRVDAVREVSFDVGRGETYGLVGESGSGKSTVLRALCGLVAPYSGAVTIAGQRHADARRGLAFHRRVQMVFQDPYGSLHPRQTVDTALSEPLAIHRISGKDRGRRVERMLDEVGLDRRFRFRYPHQLSGGQRQRVAIARALMLEPQVLLLDEPTSALDVSVQAEVLNMLERLRAEHRLTYLLVSHDLAVVAHLCDRLLVMQHGAAVEELSAADLAAENVTHPYTRQLLLATRGYDRAVIDNFVDFAF